MSSLYKQMTDHRIRAVHFWLRWSVFRVIVIVCAAFMCLLSCSMLLSCALGNQCDRCLRARPQLCTYFSPLYSQERDTSLSVDEQT